MAKRVPRLLFGLSVASVLVFTILLFISPAPVSAQSPVTSLGCPTDSTLDINETLTTDHVIVVNTTVYEPSDPTDFSQQVSDSAGNTYTGYTRDTGVWSGWDYQNQIFVAQNSNGLTNGGTITGITDAGNGYNVTLCAVAISGVGITPVDSTSATGSGATYTAGSLTAGADGALFIGGWFRETSGENPTPSSPYQLAAMDPLGYGFMQTREIGPSGTDAVDGTKPSAGSFVGSAIALPRKTEVCGVTAGNSYTLGDATVTIGPSGRGDIECLQVYKYTQDHPNATFGIRTGAYWTITADNGSGSPASGFDVSITLTYAGADADSRVCKWPGGLGGDGWDCGDGSNTTFGSGTVTRSGVTSFSDWAVGNNVGPTSVTLRSATAQAGTPSVPTPVALVLLLGGAGALVLYTRRTPSNR